MAHQVSAAKHDAMLFAAACVLVVQRSTVAETRQTDAQAEPRVATVGCLGAPR